MRDYIAVCIPKKLLTVLLGKSNLKIEEFLEIELPQIIENYNTQVVPICLTASSPEMVIKILSWKNPDLYVIHVRDEECTSADS